MKTTGKSKASRPTTIDGWRKWLTRFERDLVNEVWKTFRSSGKWPMLRVLCSLYGKHQVSQAVSRLTDAVGWDENGQNQWKCYRLTLLGVLLTSDGERLQILMVRFFEYQRHLFLARPHESYSKHGEISKYLGLDSDATNLLGQLLALGSLGGSIEGGESWGVSAMDEASDFPPVGDLTNEFERWLMRRFNARRTTPVPFFDQRDLESQFLANMGGQRAVTHETHPPEINASLMRLRERFPDANQLGFLVMRFTGGKAMRAIVKTIKQTARKLGLEVVRADEVHFHTDLWGNIRTMLHGCAFGIAVYERIDTNEANANVGLEVGYLMAMNKPVLLLKDKTLGALHSDLAGRLYVNFDTHSPQTSIPNELEKWLIANGIVVDR